MELLCYPHLGCASQLFLGSSAGVMEVSRKSNPDFSSMFSEPQQRVREISAFLTVPLPEIQMVGHEHWTRSS
jgi:hypothetical protein